MSFKTAIIVVAPVASCWLGSSLCPTWKSPYLKHNSRSQGATLDLRRNTGIAAIKAAGLYEDYFPAYCRFESSVVRVGDKRVHFHLQFAAIENGDPEIDWSELRFLLAESLPEGMIRWKKLRKIGENLDLDFDCFIETGFDLVFGAEGAWRKVRNFLTEEKPVFSGIAGYLLSIHSAAETAPDVSKLVNRVSVFSCSDAKSIMAQQMNNKSIYVNAWLQQDEDPNSLDTKEGTPTKDDICKTSKVWAPELLHIL